MDDPIVDSLNDGNRLVPLFPPYQAAKRILASLRSPEGRLMALITCVHQSSELYGSDRSFADTVSSLSHASEATNLQVVLPGPGPLVGLLKACNATLVFRSLWVPRKAEGLKTLMRLPLLPFAVYFAVKDIKKSNLVYINTIVVFDYVIAAGFCRRGNVVIHIREIAPRRLLPILRALLRFSQATLVYNSCATKAAYSVAPTREHVVYNGFRDPGACTVPRPRGRQLRVLLIGRINKWKGQDLALEALAALDQSERNSIQLMILGSVYPGQEAQERKLLRIIERNDLRSHVVLRSFVEDPSEYYKWCDIVLVPSRQPEPFGRVAIEGMSYGRPVLAACHGGLPEIVEDGRSGWLFKPNDPGEIATRLRSLLLEPDMVSASGIEARERFQAKFTLSQTQEALKDVLQMNFVSAPEQTSQKWV